MDNGIFRQKSTARLKSAEHLTDYIRVTTPPRWLYLLAIGLLLAGLFALVTAELATVHTVTAGLCSDGIMTCYVREADLPIGGGALTLRVEDTNYPATLCGDEPIQLAADTDTYLLHLSGLSQEEWVRVLTAAVPLADGVYQATLYRDYGNASNEPRGGV